MVIGKSPRINGCIKHHWYTHTKYKFYDSSGKGYRDTGKGTFSSSDFHHNGDLDNWNEEVSFKNYLGKIYGLIR